jgi:hypothetical protein
MMDFSWIYEGFYQALQLTPKKNMDEAIISVMLLAQPSHRARPAGEWPQRLWRQDQRGARRCLGWRVPTLQRHHLGEIKAWEVQLVFIPRCG